jgi:mono/diheme cytochrome c family protein
MRHLTSLVLIAASATSLAAQSASLVYKLGKDTIAIEQYTRTATSLTGEMVQRSGMAVVRVQYRVTLGADGRPTTASITRLQGDGTLAPNSPSETRFTVRTDSIVREVVYADSTQRRAFAAKQAMINFPTFVYGPTELLALIRKAGGSTDSIPALGAGGTLGFAGFAPAGGDTVRLRGGAYAMMLQFDANSRLQVLDGTGTTNKAIAVRGPGGLDIAGIAKSMTPMGVLSPREDVRAAFGPGGMVVVDYGRPQVRERTVWGGTLVPFDSVWRAGANDATHLFTTRILTMGDLTVAPGMYTLWVQHARIGTFLIVNKQTGQWGTQYNPAQDVGRVPMQMGPTPFFVEEFTISLKAQGPARGVIELAWGASAASVPFGVSLVPPPAPQPAPTPASQAVTQSAAAPTPVPTPAPKAAAAPVVAPAVGTVGDPAAGKPLYEANCQKCHGARGIPAKAMKTKFDKLMPFDALFFAKRSDDSVMTILTKGKGESMKSFAATLSRSDMANVAAYIRTLAKP